MITHIENYLKQKGLSPEAIRTIICQAAHETGYWQSKLFELSFNMFGMKSHGRKVSGKKKETIEGYASYTSIEGSLNDIIDWNRRVSTGNKIENIIEYVGFLKKKGYFEDSEENYRAGTLNAYKKLFPESWAKYNQA